MSRKLSMQPHPAITESMRREIARAIDIAVDPPGMSVHDGKARIDASLLLRMLAIIDAPQPGPTPAQEGSAAEREAQPQRKPAWKVGNELAPYHPDASHVHPGYRNGWNACYHAMQRRESTEWVTCDCGDEYPATSFEAGYICAAGRCSNCDAKPSSEPFDNAEDLIAHLHAQCGPTEAHPMLCATHYCKDCAALWRQCDDFSFTLRSQACCTSCDNAPVGGQLFALTTPVAMPRPSEPTEAQIEAAADKLIDESNRGDWDYDEACRVASAVLCAALTAKE